MENKEGEGIGVGFYSHSSDPAKTNWFMKVNPGSRFFGKMR